MKIKLFLFCILTHDLFAFMTPKDIMSRMTFTNAKKMMLMPLHPEKKIDQGLRLIEDASRIISYKITNLSQQSSRSIHIQKVDSLSKH